MVADLRSSSKSREDITKVTSVGGQNLIGKHGTRHVHLSQARGRAGRLSMRTSRRKCLVLPAAIVHWLVSDLGGPILGRFFRL